MLGELKNYIDPPVRGSRIVFFHVPKCAGTAVTRAITKLYKPWRPGQDGRVHPLNELSARTAEGVLEINQRDLRNPLLAYALAQPGSELVIGHYTFSQAVFDTYHREWNFTTVLRDPVERWLSHYYFNVSRQSSKYAITDAITDFVRTERGRHIGALTVNLFSDGLSPYGPHGDAAIATALENLRAFQVVGRVDNLGDFATQFEAVCGKRLDIGRTNVGPRKGHYRDEDPAVIEEIKSVCGPDLELYAELFTRSEPGRKRIG